MVKEFLSQRNIAYVEKDVITAKKGYGTIRGAYIGRVKSGSPAERANLKPGDIITGLNRQDIVSAAEFEKIAAGLNQGDRFTVIYPRENQKHASEGILQK